MFASSLQNKRLRSLPFPLVFGRDSPAGGVNSLVSTNHSSKPDPPQTPPPGRLICSLAPLAKIKPGVTIFPSSLANCQQTGRVDIGVQQDRSGGYRLGQSLACESSLGATFLLSQTLACTQRHTSKESMVNTNINLTKFLLCGETRAASKETNRANLTCTVHFALCSSCIKFRGHLEEGEAPKSHPKPCVLFPANKIVFR